MKRLVFFSLLLASTFSSYATDTSVSVQVGQPGFYGRIDIGNFPTPDLIYTRPVIIQSPPTRVIERPIYLHVPPGHAKHWSKHCRKYNACGRPVYFVKEDWYNEVYVPRYSNHDDHDHYDKQDDHGKHGKKNHGHGHGRGHDKD